MAWEIVNRGDEVRALLGLPVEMELMAVVAAGHPTDRDQGSSRKGMHELILKEL